MAKGLDALKVSLTKNGYFKVAEVIKIIREDYGNLQDHLAVVQMDYEQGRFNMEGLVNSEDYIKGMKEEAEKLEKLLEINL